jgi:hypothetical protein
MRLSNNNSSVGNSVTSSSTEAPADDSNSSITTTKVSVPVPTMVRNEKYNKRDFKEYDSDLIRVGSKFFCRISLFGVLMVSTLSLSLSLSLSLFRRIESNH